MLLQLSVGSAGNGLGSQSVGELDWDGKVVWRLNSARRQPNGNTLIDEGMNGRFFQVTVSGENVWEYASPFLGKAPGKDAICNWVYRASRVS